MTVRTWFTISALVLIALSVAIVFRLRQPAPQPEILARVGQIRLEGELRHSCWPKSGGEITCLSDDQKTPGIRTIPKSGEMDFSAYPVEPNDGTITFEDASGDVVLEEDWDDEIGYDLRSGLYDITVNADYGDEASVRYLFRVRIS
ncbi:MAG: hypothetical protein WD826_09860 [Actinomycetota bacterium]